jgi:hypothetical protein
LIGIIIKGGEIDVKRSENCIGLMLMIGVSGLIPVVPRNRLRLKTLRILAAVRTAASIQSPKQIEPCRGLVNTEVGKVPLSAELEKELSFVFDLPINRNGNRRKNE